MATREIIEIDEDSCDGCGACAVGCREGALQVIDGKARLVGESLCDGLGACIGECPRGAITVTRREAEAYDEAKVMEGLSKLGPKVIEAHLEHLRGHGQDAYVREALAFMAERGIPVPAPAMAGHDQGGGCPGSASRRFGALRPQSPQGSAALGPAALGAAPKAATPSALSHWPIQMHLINPRGPQYAGADLLLAADCTAFSLGSFHADLLAGKSLAIACPKLDQGKDIYTEKLSILLGVARSITVAIMEVPCCSGLLKMVLDARETANKRPAIEAITLGIEGGILARRMV
jgi:NAD-dependent dihydropyrimidine dehydrogenase PreA subunit